MHRFQIFIFCGTFCERFKEIKCKCFFQFIVVSIRGFLDMQMLYEVCFIYILIHHVCWIGIQKSLMGYHKHKSRNSINYGRKFKKFFNSVVHFFHYLLVYVYDLHSSLVMDLEVISVEIKTIRVLLEPLVVAQ